MEYFSVDDAAPEQDEYTIGLEEDEIEEFVKTKLDEFKNRIR